VLAVAHTLPLLPKAREKSRIDVYNMLTSIILKLCSRDPLLAWQDARCTQGAVQGGQLPIAHRTQADFSPRADKRGSGGI